jgi:hypothetical protein
VTADAETLAYRRLACAILEQAILDARDSCPEMAARARHWLISSPWAADLLTWVAPDLAIDVMAWVRDLPEVVQLPLDL